jgi:glycerol kinase
VKIQVYKTSGAEGAAQAAAVGAGIIDRLDYYQTYLEKVQVYEPDPNWEGVRDIYSEWENQLKKQVQIDE